MRKKNLNWLLALLAALALVFAGACSDGSDDPASDDGSGTEQGGNGNQSNTCNCSTSGCTGGTSCNACDDNDCCNDCGSNATEESYTVAGKKFAYEGEEIGTHTPSGASDGDTNTYLASVELEFAAAGTSMVDITVTYQVCTYNGSNHSTEGNWDASYDTEYEATIESAGYLLTDTTLTVTLPSNAGTLTFSVDSENNKLTLTGAKQSGGVDDLTSYTVGTDGGGCDLFSESVNGKLTAATSDGSEFALDD